jgi:hypothetical protein
LACDDIFEAVVPEAFLPTRLFDPPEIFSESASVGSNAEFEIGNRLRKEEKRRKLKQKLRALEKTQKHSVRRGVSKGVEDGRRPSALRVGHSWNGRNGVRPFQWWPARRAYKGRAWRALTILY